MSRLRLGLIGCGWIAAAHVRAAAELADRCSLLWAADPDVARAEGVAAQAGSGCRALADYREGLAEVDAVIIATPHHLHAPVVLEAARARRHMLLEKPLATTLEDADHMLAAVDEAGVTLMVGYTRHYQPEFRRLRALCAVVPRRASLWLRRGDARVVREAAARLIGLPAAECARAWGPGFGAAAR